MKIKELQAVADLWHVEAKLGSESERQARRVLHHAGEVVGAAAWDFATEGTGVAEARHNDLGDRLADVVISAFNLASMVGFSMDDLLRARLDELRE